MLHYFDLERTSRASLIVLLIFDARPPIGIEVPLFFHKDRPYIRISAHVYNTSADYIELAYVVLKVLHYPDDHPNFVQLEDYRSNIPDFQIQ